MAKNIIALNGSASTSMTLYTVPTGRVAKVVVNQFNKPYDGQYYGPALYVGNLQYGVGPISYSQLFYVSSLSNTTATAIGDDCIAFGGGSGVSSGGSPFLVLPRTTYLPAGSPVYLSGANSLATMYNILIVEEY